MTATGSGAKVVKSSGETETFDPNVITSDCIEAGVEFWTAAEVALEVSKDVFDGISGGEIQEKTLTALYQRDPEVAERYKRFHSMYVRTSQNTIEAFDRKRIVNSLVKETALPKEVAETIAKEAETELRRLNLDFTSGPLIREIVNVKLLEHGYESARSDYTRLGMPVYDAARFIESAGAQSSPENVHRHMANSIFREYTLLKVLPLHLADAHMKGDIHVHGLEHFVTRPYTAFHDPRFFMKNGLSLNRAGLGGSSAPAKNAQVAILHTIRALAAYSSSFSSSQGLHSFNVWLAPYLEGLSNGQIKQLAQTTLFEIAQSTSIGGSSLAPIDLSIEYGVPETLAKIPAILPGGNRREDITYSNFEKEARRFAKALTEEYLKGDSTGAAFRSPRLIYALREGDEEKEGYADYNLLIHKAAATNRTPSLLNLRTSRFGPGTCAHSSGIVLTPDAHDMDDLSKGSMMLSGLQSITVNLPRIAYKSGGSDKRFFEVLDETMGLARDVAMVKREVIKKRLGQRALPLLSGETDSGRYFDLDRSFILIGYVGLNEAVKAHTDEELHEGSTAFDFGVSVMKHVSDTLYGWSEGSGLKWVLSSNPHPVAAHRFAMLDSGQHTDSVVVKGNHKSGTIHYTDSCHFAEDADMPLMERLKAESPFRPLNTDGVTEMVGVKRKTPQELVALTEKLVDMSIGYWRYVP